MVIDRPGATLRLEERPIPTPANGQVLVRVHACGVCRTDLHVADGELPQAHYPVVPGHEIVGEVAALGEGVTGLSVGVRVGVPWLGSVCGQCRYCRAGDENLCDLALFTGCNLDGGLRSTWLPMPASASVCRRNIPMPKRHRFSAPA
jgi:propanol-preferring alcohol dehydrogenase